MKVLQMGIPITATGAIHMKEIREVEIEVFLEELWKQWSCFNTCDSEKYKRYWMSCCAKG
ncbi:MAG: hypothetical protein ACLSAC_26930 [Enterocloster bolteae]